jgi:hypothetical protein
MTTSKKIKVKRQQKQTIYSRCLRKSFSYFCGNHACQKTVQHFIRRRRIYDPVSFYLFFFILQHTGSVLRLTTLNQQYFSPMLTGFLIHPEPLSHIKSANM